MVDPGMVHGVDPAWLHQVLTGLCVMIRVKHSRHRRHTCIIFHAQRQTVGCPNTTTTTTRRLYLWPKENATSCRLKSVDTLGLHTARSLLSEERSSACAHFFGGLFFCCCVRVCVRKVKVASA